MTTLTHEDVSRILETNNPADFAEAEQGVYRDFATCFTAAAMDDIEDDYGVQDAEVMRAFRTSMCLIFVAGVLLGRAEAAQLLTEESA